MQPRSHPAIPHLPVFLSILASPDPANELPRYGPVAPKDALATWKVKPGFKIQLAAHETQVRDPIAICFDENGRMFVCEMLDHPQARDTDGQIASVQLFGKGYLRAEAKLDAPQTDRTFTLSNLFDGDKTFIATAVDNDGHVGLSAPLRLKIKPSPPEKKSSP